MNHRTTGKVSNTFTLAIIILVFVIITSLAVIGRTWASDPAGHTLTYTVNKLTWDQNTSVGSDGSAQLDVFHTSYDNVDSENGDKLIAPGTSSSDSIVLRNMVDRSVTYTAIAYYIKNDERIPVEMEFAGTELTDTETYVLPSGIVSSNVLRAVSGRLPANGQQDFTISWKWDYETDGAASDSNDTALGQAVSSGSDESVIVGLYVVVSDEGAVIQPTPEETGDDKQTDKDAETGDDKKTDKDEETGDDKQTGNSVKPGNDKQTDNSVKPGNDRQTVNSVKTGDDNRILLYAALLIAGILGMLLILAGNRRSRRKR